MKRVFLSVAILLFVTAVEIFAQGGAMFQMIRVSAPDSVVFTMAKGQMVAGVSVYLISGTQSFEGTSFASGGMSIRNGRMYLTDETIITAKNFKAPAGFRAQKIKFDTGDMVLYYDIAKKAWESNQNASVVKTAETPESPPLSSTEKSIDGVFEVLRFSNDSVTFKAVEETKFYAAALVSGNQVFEAGFFSNSVESVRWENGAQLMPGSSMSMPAAFGSGAMTLPQGAILTVFGFKTPADFKPAKIRFITDGKNEMFFDISQFATNLNRDEKPVNQLADEKPASQGVQTQANTPVVEQAAPTPQQAPPATQQTTPATQKAQPEVTVVQQLKPLPQSEKWRRWYIESGLSIGIWSPDPKFKTMVPVGAVIDFGFYITPRNRLSLDMTFGSNNIKIGTFDYTKTYSDGKKENFTDGVIRRDYSARTALLSYHYVFTPSEKFNIRLGASIGSFILTASNRYIPAVDNTPGKFEEDAVMMVYGGGFGFIWNFGKRWFMDAGYRVLANEGLEVDDFEVTAPVHQIGVILGWRF